MKRTKKNENMEDFKIGDEIKLVLKVVDNNGEGCDNCFFVEDGMCRKPINRFVGGFGCLKGERSDHKDVRFELVSCTENTKATLWHNASEEPEENKKLLVQYTNYMVEDDYEIDMNIPYVSWRYLVTTYNFKKWCYIEDLLPKGGEK